VLSLGRNQKDIIAQMKKTALILLTLFITQWTHAQEPDSLATEPEVKPITEEVVSSDSLVVGEATLEPMVNRDTVFIREVVYDTVYVNGSKPLEIQTENVDLFTQNKPRKRPEIKTLSGSLGHSGGFGALTFRSSTFRGQTMVMAGLRGGWIINRSLAIGLEGHGIIPTAKFEGLSQFDVVAIGGYGGMFLEPIFFSNQIIHLTFPVSAGSGWLGYHEDFDEARLSNPELIEGDVFWYVEPGANVELNLARNFRLALGLSKRFTQDLELIDTRSKDFNKINYYLTLKIGSL